MTKTSISSLVLLVQRSIVFILFLQLICLTWSYCLLSKQVHWDTGTSSNVKYRYSRRHIPKRLSSRRETSDTQDQSRITDKFIEDDHRNHLPLYDCTTRRWILVRTIAMPFVTSCMPPTQTVNAAMIRGAAELDMEYYLRDIFGTNNERMGNVLPSQPPLMKVSRTIQQPLLDLILKDTLTYNDGSATVRALIETVLQQETNTIRSAKQQEERIVELQNQIQQSVQLYQDKVSDSFYKRAAWNKSSLQNQYYFDMISYTIWKTASVLLPASNQRISFNQKLGQYIYENVIRQNLVPIPSRTTTTPNNNHPLTSTNQYIVAMLNVFTMYGFIASYEIGDSLPNTSRLSTNNNNPLSLFDSYDDEAWAQNDDNVSIDVIIRIYEAATLGASLQINGESNRFIPDYIGPTLCYMWNQLLQEPTGSNNKIRISYETYFLDSTYRPNPKGTFVCPLVDYLLHLSTSFLTTRTFLHYLSIVTSRLFSR